MDARAVAAVQQLQIKLDYPPFPSVPVLAEKGPGRLLFVDLSTIQRWLCLARLAERSLVRDTCKRTSRILLGRGGRTMSPMETLSLVLGTGFSSGLNLYATVATLGLLERFGVIHLPEKLQVLAHPFVLGVALTMYLVEFLADKVPYIDSVWQAVHTFIRPPAAALLAFSVTASAAEPWRWAAALLAGSIALTSHGTKASARAAANMVPEPLSNWALSFGEDILAVWLTWFATAHPTVAVIVVVVLQIGRAH